ncbi:hypothetical protein HDU88_001481 [Geranomyces variabilis]|nr:hypothetical protein HDU88_001481 [Geranomyces variabilis]
MSYNAEPSSMYESTEWAFHAAQSASTSSPMWTTSALEPMSPVSGTHSSPAQDPVHTPPSMDLAASFFPIADPTFGPLNEGLFPPTAMDFWATGSENLSQMPFFDNLSRFSAMAEAQTPLPAAEWPLDMQTFYATTTAQQSPAGMINPAMLEEKPMPMLDIKEQYLAQDQFLYEPLAASAAAAAAAAAADMAESLVRSAFAPLTAKPNILVFTPPASPLLSGHGSGSEDGAAAEAPPPRPLTKAERKKLRENTRNLTCHNCGTHKTPLWRRTADKRHSVCNACGLYFKQYQCNRPTTVRGPRDGGVTAGGGGPIRPSVSRPAARAAPHASAVSMAPAVPASTAASVPTAHHAIAIKSELPTPAMTPLSKAAAAKLPSPPTHDDKQGTDVKTTAPTDAGNLQQQQQQEYARNASHFRSRVAQLPIADAQRLLQTLERQLAFVRNYCAASETAVC